MERIKNIILIIFLLIFLSPTVYSDTVNTPSPQVQRVTDCVKTFPIGYEKLYYLTLSALNKYNYKIDEIQSKGGYIIFNQNNREFLATIIYVSSEKSILKITPADCNYNFSKNLPQIIFNYVETYQNNNY